MAEQCRGSLSDEQYDQQSFAGHAYKQSSFRGRGLMFMTLLTFIPDPPGVIYLGEGSFLVHIRTMVELLEFKAKANSDDKRNRHNKIEFMSMIKYLQEMNLILEYHTGSNNRDNLGLDFVVILLKPVIDNFGEHKIPADDYASVKEFKFKELFLKGGKYGIEVAKEKAKELHDRTLPRCWTFGAITGFERGGNFANADELLAHWKRYKRLPVTEQERECHKQATYERRWAKRIADANRVGGPRKKAKSRNADAKKSNRK